MSHFLPALTYARANRQRFLDELMAFVRYPSVSAQPHHTSDVKACASWLVKHLKRIGLEQAQTIPTKRHPIVYAHWRGALGQPTLLIYGHYDVVPAESGNWITPPFEPSLRGQHLYARGASDDKGPLMAHLAALESCFKSHKRLPINVVLLLDGEEEIGSPNLKAFMECHGSSLKADAAVISDTRMLGPNRPTIITSLRGSFSVQLEVCGAARDLHAGAFGGAVHNPAQVLCEMLASLYDADGRIAIPGMYSTVLRLSDAARKLARDTFPSDGTLLRDAGVRLGWGERGYSAFERTTLRPALNITGISAGYNGHGHKSIIPARASAKLNLRLVLDQDPQHVYALLSDHLKRLTPSTVRVSLKASSMTHPVRINPQNPAVQSACIALERGFGVRPVLLPSGGSIPVVNLFKNHLNLETVLMGFALPNDGMHAVNERFDVPTFFRAVETCLHFYGELARSRSTGLSIRQTHSRTPSLERLRS
jgi:acetylornithine deacetylase/succinyl-diaminopimelate desuccinylase-like protein